MAVVVMKQSRGIYATVGSATSAVSKYPSMHGNKRPTGCNRMIIIAKLIVRSTCLGHHYAHNQKLKSYTDGCCLWYMALWFTGRWSGVEL